MSHIVPDDKHLDSLIRVLYPEERFPTFYFPGLCATISERIHEFRSVDDFPPLRRDQTMRILGYGESRKKDRSLNYLYNSLHASLGWVSCNNVSFMSNTQSNDKHVMLALLLAQEHDKLTIGKQISSDETLMKKISDLKDREERNREQRRIDRMRIRGRMGLGKTLEMLNLMRQLQVTGFFV